jgi:hypothetical protein
MGQAFPPQVRNIVEHERLEVGEVIRSGPRYWIGRVRRAGRWMILKVLLDNTIQPSPGGGSEIDPAGAMETEIRLFLALQRSKRKGAGEPEVVGYELGRQPWLLRALQQGHSLSAGLSPTIFSDELYRPEVTEALVDSLARLQELKSEFKGLIKPVPLKHMTSKDYLEPVGLVAPYARDAWAALQSEFDYYDDRLDAVTHGQAFPPHIYLHNGLVSLIDWEDAGMRSKMYDFVTVWLRGFMNEPWKRSFLNTLRQRGILATQEDERLWQIETLVQSYGMLIYFHWTQVETPAQRLEAVNSLKHQVEAVLGGNLILE